jgi:Zn-dependent metalloprotease
MSCYHPHSLCEIIPNRVLVKLLEKEKNEKKKNRLLNHIKQSAGLRSKRAVAYNYREVQRTIAASLRKLTEKNIHFYDCDESHDLPEKTTFEINQRYPRRKSQPKPTTKKKMLVSKMEIDNMSTVYDFWHENFKRESFDAQSAVIKYYGNYGKDYDNAFWDGENLVFGLGDPSFFHPFGNFIDIQAHELGHAILQYEADFIYDGMSGALNEHVADVFGICVKHWTEGKEAGQASWLLGEGLWVNKKYKALRSMSAPGTAYPDDDQPEHMSNFYNGREDNGGVHINSGIPNKVFYHVATRLGDNSWDKPLKIWYQTIKDQRVTNKNTSFGQFAIGTYKVAKKKFGESVADTVRDSWKLVGLIV